MTSYSRVYEMNKVIKNDPRLANLDACELNAIRFRYLQYAISYFVYDCRKDLNKRSDPQSMSYEFEGDGLETEFILSPTPPDGIDLVVYLIQDGVPKELKEFNYNSEYNTITFSVPIAPGTGLLVKTFTTGYFEEDLDIRELNILSEGMIVPYLEEAKNDENAMKYIISGKSLRFFSQANHLEAMNTNVASQAYKMVGSLISEYSYKGSVDNYKSMSGRGEG